MNATLLHQHAPAVMRWWERTSPREHALVGTAVMAVAGAFAWIFIGQPMLVDIARLQRDNARNHAVLAAAHAQAADLVALAREPAPASGASVRTALERAIAERGLRPVLTSIDAQENRVRVLFNGVRFDALAAMLDVLARTDGVLLVDAILTTRVEPGTVRAELTFVRG